MKFLKRFLCMALTAVMLVGTVPAQALAPVRTPIPEVRIPEEFLASDVFYFASETADLNEGTGGQYTLRLLRGGDAAEAATIEVKITDVTAKYGRDYTVSLMDGESKVEGAEDSVSLMDLIVGQPYTEMPILDEEEAIEQIEDDAEALEAFNETSQEAAQYLEDATGLEILIPDVQENAGEEEVVEAVKAAVEEETEELPEAAVTEGAMDETRRILSGTDVNVQTMNAETDMLQSVQALADVLNSVAPGAALNVSFAEGEKEKTLLIDVKNNRQSDGDRYFYLLLTEPTGSTIVSKMGCCAITILDDEEEILPTVGIENVETDEENGKYRVTLRRDGLLNDMVTVRMTSDAGRGAIAGRDYSPVDTQVAFPMGMDVRTVEIPYSTENLTEDGSFTLSLSEPDGCELGESTAAVTLKAGAATPSLGATAVKPNLLLYPTDNDRKVDISNAAHKLIYNYGYYDTADSTNAMVGDAWKFGWWNFSDTAQMSASWFLPNGGYHGYEIGGAIVEWGVEDGTAGWRLSSNSTYLSYDTHIGPSGRNSVVYERGNMAAAIGEDNYVGAPASWSSVRHAETYYFNDDNASYFCAAYKNYQGHEGSAYIYSITPLYKPFELKIAQVKASTSTGSGRGDTVPKFNDGFGTLEPWQRAGFRFAENAEQSQTIVRYGLEDENYSRVSIVPVDDGFSPLLVTSWGPASDSYRQHQTSVGRTSSVSFKLTPFLINDWSPYLITYKDNSAVTVAAGNGTAAATARYGEIDLGLETSYRDAKVTVNPACINVKGTAVRDASVHPGTISISGYDYGDAAVPTVVTDKFVMGDKIRVVLTSTDPNYVPDRVEYTLPNGEYGTLFANVNEPGVFYLSGSAAYTAEGGIPRLKCEEITLTPVFKEKDNKVRVFLKTSDAAFFDPSSLLMTANGGISNWPKTTINGVEYYAITLASGTTYGTIVPLTTAIAESYLTSKCAVWQQPGDPDISTRTYRGDTFYMRSRGSSEADEVYLSAESCGNTYQTVSGRVVHNLYDMKRAELVDGTFPTEYATVALGSHMATTNADGEFLIAPFRMGGPSADRWIRLLVSGDGYQTYQDICLNSTAIYSEKLNGTTSVNAYRQFTGSIRLNTAESSFSHYVSLQAANPGEGIDVCSTNIAIKGETIVMTLRQNGKPLYNKLDEKGNIVQENCEESLTAVTFIIKDPEGNELRKITAAKSGDTYTAVIPLQVISNEGDPVEAAQYTVYGGCRIFAELETDCAPNSKQEKTVYRDLFTGYQFVPSGDVTILPPQRVAPNLGFSFDADLPLIGSSGGMMFNLPYVTVGMLWLGNGYRLVFGVNVGSIIDAVKGSHVSSYWSGDEELRKTLPKSGDGLIAAIKDSLDLQDASVLKFFETARKEGSTGSAGSPEWKFNLSTGFYIDFAKVKIAEGISGDSKTNYKFIGVGGYLGVFGGFRVAWYTILPVVYIPAYFGVEITADALGFFGAGYDLKTLQVDPSYSRYSLQDALDTAQINFTEDMDFQGSVRASIAARVYAGIGMAGIVGIEGGAMVNSVYMYQPNQIAEVKSDHGGQVQIAGQIKINLLVFSVPININIKTWRFGFFYEWDTAHPKNTLQSASPQVSSVMLRSAVSDEMPEWVEQTPRLQATMQPVRSEVLEYNAYENADVQLVTLDNGNILMVYEENDVSRTDPNRGVLKYVVFKDGNRISEPKAVFDDRTGDYYPSVCAMKDGKAAVVWMSTDPERLLPETADPNFAVEYLSAAEIYYAVIDTENDNVTDITQLTNDNCYDFCPSVVYDSALDETFVLYSKTDKQPQLEQNASSDDQLEALMQVANAYINESMTFYQYHTTADGWCADVRSYDGFKWTNVASDKVWSHTEYENQAQFDKLYALWKGQRILKYGILFGDTYMDYPVVTDLAMTCFDGCVCMAFTVDTDSRLDTNADREIYMMCYDMANKEAGYPFRITQNNESDDLPQFACYDASEAYLCWYHDGKSIQSFNFMELVNFNRNYGVLEEHYDNDPSKPYYRIDPEFLEDRDEYQKNPDGTLSNVLIHKAEVGKYHDISEFFNTIQPKMAEGQTSLDMSDYQLVVNGNDSFIVWTQPVPTDREDEDGNFCLCRELYAIGYCEEEGEKYQTGWSEPIRLTFTDSMVKNFRAVMDGSGTMYAVYNNYNERLTDDDVLIDDMKLAYTVLEPFGSVDVTGISLSNTTPAVGDKLKINVAVKNTGLTKADSYTLSLYAVTEAGETQIGTLSGEKLYAGWSQTHEFTWTVPENFEGVHFVAKATESGYDGQCGSCSSETLEYKPVFEVHNVVAVQEKDGFVVTAQITNKGNAPTIGTDKAMLRLCGPYDLAFNIPNEECVLGTTVLPELQPGETQSVSVAVHADADLFERFGYVECLVGVTRDDETLEDSTVSKMLYPVSPLLTLLNGEAIPQEITLRKGGSQALSTTYQPVIFNGFTTVSFITDDPSVAKVENGRLKAVSEGTTVLHGLMLQSGVELPDIEITVTDTASDNNDDSYEIEIPYNVEISASEIAKVGTNVVSMDFSGLNKRVDEVKFSTSTMKAIAESASSGLEIRLSTGTVTFDAEAVDAISNAAGGRDITLNVETVDAKTLSATQKSVVNGLGNAVIIKVTLTSGGKTISDFGYGSAAVTVPYEKQDAGKTVEVYYLDNSGMLTKMNATYDAATKSVTITAPHFSEYVITEADALPFADVDENAFYADAVYWAVANGITNGTDAAHFSPKESVTRAQVVTFLWRAAGCPAPKGNASKFADVPADKYYADAVAWAIEQGITNGITETEFGPKEVCTRCQIVTFLYRFAGAKDADTDTGFTDVIPTKYYAAAVKWAKDNKVTEGTSTTAFSPNADCTRAQVVTFLYRWMVK